MNRFKKEIRKRGFRLESDLPCLPYELKGHNYIVLDSIFINSERATIVEFYNIDTLHYEMLRNGEIVEIVFNDGNPHF